MPFKTSNRCRSFEIVLFAAFFIGCAIQLLAEDDPPATDRIVSSRPRLYSFKRAIHPVGWIEGATKPLFRSAEGGLINRLTSGKQLPSMRVGVNGMGASSGLGPEITFFNKSMFGRGIEIEIPLLRIAVAIGIDLVEFHRGIELHHGKRHAAEECLAREPQHDIGILADRPQHAERLQPVIGFAQDVDALRLELVEMVHRGLHVAVAGRPGVYRQQTFLSTELSV